MYKCLIGIILILVISSQAWTATIEIMNDPAAMISGSQIFEATDGAETLRVEVQYAVYYIGDYPGNDPSNGTEYVYAYQIFNDIDTQSHSVSSFTVGLPAERECRPAVIGFDRDYMDTEDEGVAPTLFAITDDSAAWTFLYDTISAPDEYSKVLFFASPCPPGDGTASVQDGGLSDFGPIPVPMIIPEPITILSLGLVQLLIRVVKQKE